MEKSIQGETPDLTVDKRVIFYYYIGCQCIYKRTNQNYI